MPAKIPPEAQRVPLRRLRVTRAWTIAELATRAGCAQTTIARAETGQSAPIARTRRAIAAALEYPVECIAWRS